MTHGITVADRTMLDIRFEAVDAADLPNGWRARQRLACAGSSNVEPRDGKIAQIVDWS